MESFFMTSTKCSGGSPWCGPMFKSQPVHDQSWTLWSIMGLLGPMPWSIMEKWPSLWEAQNSVCDRSWGLWSITNNEFSILIISWFLGGPQELEIIFGCSYMCVDTFWVILHEPYEATCISLPSWVLEPDLSLTLQGLIVEASSQMMSLHQ